MHLHRAHLMVVVLQVYEGLYIGSLMAEMNRNALLRAGITDVLQVGTTAIAAPHCDQRNHVSD